MNKLYFCGPVSIQLCSDTIELYQRAAEVFGLYMHWEESQPPVHVHIHSSEQDAEIVEGNWLRAVGVHVDKTSTGLYATCRSGASARLKASETRWDIYMPARYANGALT